MWEDACAASRSGMDVLPTVLMTKRSSIKLALVSRYLTEGIDSDPHIGFYLLTLVS